MVMECYLFCQAVEAWQVSSELNGTELVVEMTLHIYLNSPKLLSATLLQ